MKQAAGLAGPVAAAGRRVRLRRSRAAGPSGKGVGNPGCCV